MLEIVVGLLARHELYVARYYLREDRFDAASARVQRVLDTLPVSGLEPEALMLLGEMYLKQKKRTEARKTFERVLTEHPDSPFVVPARHFLAHLGESVGVLRQPRRPRRLRPAARQLTARAPLPQDGCKLVDRMIREATDPGPLTLPAPTVLVVDDEKNIRRTLQMVLSGEGYGCSRPSAPSRRSSIIANPEQPVDLAIFDLKLPGHERPRSARADPRPTKPRASCRSSSISGHATVHDAVTAIKLGASDFFEKPLNRERVWSASRTPSARRASAATVEQLRAELEARYEMIGTSPPMQQLFQDIDKVAPTKASVLITGESGTGKELVSRAIHRLSPRKDAPFVKVNCAAIPRELIESELFGHERGSFTGAHGTQARLLRAGPRRHAVPRRDRRHGSRPRRPRCCARCRTARSCASAAST